jgi:hypothetical protein
VRVSGHGGYLLAMMLLALLWFAVLNALASTSPAPLRGGGSGPPHVASVRQSSANDATSGGGYRDGTPTLDWRFRPRGHHGLRTAAPGPLPTVGRIAGRGADARRSFHGGAASIIAHRLLPGAARSRTAPGDVSHAAVARGGHLPYFPTAPPFQG